MIHVSVCIAFWYTLYPSLKILILLSDIARFAFRLSPFHGAIWCFSSPEMGHFASWNGTYCKTGKYSLILSYWYSISCKNLLFFAYLRPKETQPANTRLFLGYIRKLRVKSQKTVTIWKSPILFLFQEKKIFFRQNKKL